MADTDTGEQESSSPSSSSSFRIRKERLTAQAELLRELLAIERRLLESLNAARTRDVARLLAATHDASRCLETSHSAVIAQLREQARRLEQDLKAQDADHHLLLPPSPFSQNAQALRTIPGLGARPHPRDAPHATRVEPSVLVGFEADVQRSIAALEHRLKSQHQRTSHRDITKDCQGYTTSTPWGISARGIPGCSITSTGHNACAREHGEIVEEDVMQSSDNMSNQTQALHHGQAGDLVPASAGSLLINSASSPLNSSCQALHSDSLAVQPFVTKNAVEGSRPKRCPQGVRSLPTHPLPADGQVAKLEWRIGRSSSCLHEARESWKDLEETQHQNGAHADRITSSLADFLLFQPPSGPELSLVTSSAPLVNGTLVPRGSGGQEDEASLLVQGCEGMRAVDNEKSSFCEILEAALENTVETHSFMEKKEREVHALFHNLRVTS